MESETTASNNTAPVILNKLKLVDPTISNTTFSAYQQSAEVNFILSVTSKQENNLNFFSLIRYDNYGSQ